MPDIQEFLRRVRDITGVDPYPVSTLPQGSVNQNPYAMPSLAMQANSRKLNPDGSQTLLAQQKDIYGK